MATPYEDAYSGNQVGRVIAYGPSVAETQGEEEGQRAREYTSKESEYKNKETKFRQDLANNYAQRYGVSYKDAYELVNSEREAYLANQKSDLQERIKQAGYRKDLADYRSYLSGIDTRNLAEAGDKIQELATKYSYLSGALDRDIANQYDQITGLHTKALQSTMDKIQKVLPKGVALEEVLDDEGRPDFDVARSIASQTYEQREKTREDLKAARQLSLMGRREEAKKAYAQFKSNLDVQKASQMIPIKTQEAAALAPYKGLGLMVQPTITTPAPVSTKPAPSPMEELSKEIQNEPVPQEPQSPSQPSSQSGIMVYDPATGTLKPKQ
jgi:hypothetical protein